MALNSTESFDVERRACHSMIHASAWIRLALGCSFWL